MFEYRQQRLNRRRRNAGVLVERELILGDRREVDLEDLRADLFSLGVDRLARLGVEFAAAAEASFSRAALSARCAGPIASLICEASTASATRKPGPKAKGDCAWVSFAPSLIICVAPLLSCSMPTETENA